MTPKNHGYYLVLWAEVRKAHPKADRHALHRQALGYDKSSKDFTQVEFRKVRALFLEMARPGDLGVAIAAEEEDETCYRFAVRRYAAAVDGDDDWLLGIARGMAREGNFRVWGAMDRQPKFILQKLMVAVKKEARRRWPKKEDVWTAVLAWWREHDIPAEAATAAVREVLHCGAIIPPVEKWSYEDRLALLGHEKQRALQPF